MAMSFRPETLAPSWPGLTRPSRGSRELVKKIVPLGILRKDEIDLPGAWLMLDVPLALNGGANIVVAFCPHQMFQAILRNETFSDTFAMFPNTAREIAGDPDVQSSIWSVRDYVDPATSHTSIPSTNNRIENRWLDGRVKPGHDDSIASHRTKS